MRRGVRTVFGALSGVVWGLGIAVLLQQFGWVPLDPPSIYGIPLAAALLSGARAWVRRRPVAPASLIVIAAVLAPMPFLSLQSRVCEIVLDEARALSETSLGDPFEVGQDADTVHVAFLGPPTNAVAQAWVEIGGIQIEVWSGSLPEGRRDFTVSRSQSPVGDTPGLYHVGGGISGVCSVNGYVRIAGNPLTDPIVGAASTAVILGLAGAWWAGRRPPPPPPKPPPPPPEPQPPEPEPPEPEPPEPEPPPEAPAPMPPTGVRTPFVSTEIIDSVTGLSISAAAPLVSGTTYNLVVRVTLETPTEAGAALPLTVLSTSDDVDVDEVTPAMLQGGGGAIASIPFTPEAARDAAAIDFDLLYQGHLLQSQRIATPVVTTAPQQPGTSAVRAENTTFTNSDFSPAELQALPERHVTLILRHDPLDDSVKCAIIRTGSGAVVARFDTINPKEELLSAAARVRERLRGMIEDDATGYRTVLQADPGRLDRWLPALADIGHSLYLTLLEPESDAGSGLDDVMQPGTVVQVNQVASGLGKATVPWALLYEPEIDYRPGVTVVCPDFATHEANACPHADDSTVVCPWGFWGYQYVLEQPPGWRGDDDELATVATRSVGNERPLALSAAVNTTLELWQRHLAALSGIGDVELHTVTDTQGLLELWEQLGSRVDVAYFYIHAGSGAARAEPYLGLTDAPITRNNLRAWRKRLNLAWDHAPLVILNGCGTGDYGPDAFASLINEFRAFGASGVVGTECVVSEAIADAYILETLRRFASGESLGPTMLAVRRRFLLEWNNPTALVYSLYAPSDLKLSVVIAT